MGDFERVEPIITYVTPGESGYLGPLDDPEKSQFVLDGEDADNDALLDEDSQELSNKFEPAPFSDADEADQESEDEESEDEEDVGEFNDTPGETQFVYGDDAEKTFVIDADVAGYSWGPTEDGLGIVVWGPDGHDLLYGIETIQFSDQTVSLVHDDGEVEDVAYASQHLVASGSDDGFVIDGNSKDYGYGPTEDGTGIVVWGETGFDILYGFSKLIFSDTEIDLSSFDLGDDEYTEDDNIKDDEFAEDEDDISEDEDDNTEDDDGSAVDEDDTAEDGDDIVEDDDGSTDADDIAEDDDGSADADDIVEDDDGSADADDDTVEDGDDIVEDDDGSTDDDDGSTDDDNANTDDDDIIEDDDDSTEDEDDITEDDDDGSSEDDDIVEEDDGGTEDEVEDSKGDEDYIDFDCEDVLGDMDEFIEQYEEDDADS